MGKLVYEDDVIKAIQFAEEGVWGWKGEITEAIKKLQSAQPDPPQVARDIANIIENEKDMRVIARSEIIRCKECREFRRWIDTDITFCDRTESEVKEDDFCSKAERRNDE